MATNLSRRDFFGTVGGAGAAALLAETETARGYLANDTIEVGCIGTGGRCQQLMHALGQVPNVRMAAVCDVYDVHLGQAAKLADPKATTTKRYPEILERDDIDAVLIASPDHWHVQMAVDACNAGKDVYVEKPLTHDISQGDRIVTAQNQHKRIVQVGTQQRSMPQFQAAYELVRQGKLGTIHKVHLQWNRNAQGRMKRVPLGINPDEVDWKAFLGSAPDQPFDEYRFRNWRWFWDFGGGILTDLMVHFIDVAHWFLQVDHPTTATALGANYASQGVWETPDTIQCLLDYPNDCQIHFEGTFSNANRGAMIEFMGTNGTLYLDRGRMEVRPDPGVKDLEAQETVLGQGRPGRDFYDKPDGELLHLTNWIECVRSRRRPNCPAEAGVSAASAAHLGNRAFRGGSIAHWEA